MNHFKIIGNWKQTEKIHECLKYESISHNETCLLFSEFIILYDMFQPTWTSSGNMQYVQSTLEEILQGILYILFIT